MKILALDSSGLVASVAVVENDTLLAEYTVNYKKTHSQTLLPMLDEISNMTELDLSTIDAIAVAGGPGSFTGLRIGSATAKGLGLALEKPLISIPTTAAIAYNIWDTNKFVCPIMDARRNQVYTAVYQTTPEIPEQLEEPDVVPIETALERACEAAAGKPIVFLGDGVPVFEKVIKETLGDDCRLMIPARRYQSAASIALLGEYLYQKGEAVPAEKFGPVYLRKSQAEREREEKNT